MAVKLTDDAQAKIRKELLKTGEIVSKDAVDMVFTLIEIVVKDTDNKIDDVVLTFLPKIKDYVNQLLDGISDEV